MTTETERWHRIWSHREQLLKVARRRSMSMDDAEDAVHEAMVRASERPHLDDDRLGAWLTTVTIRLCVDRHRQVARDADVRGHTAHTVSVPVEDAVCDRAEAKWLARRSCELPPRQAEALWLKAEDLDVGQVARKMGLNYRTAESLLARARRTLRRALAATLAVLYWLTGHARPRTGAGVQAAGVVSTAATLAVLGFTIPGSSAPDSAGSGAARPSAGHPAAERTPTVPAHGGSGASSPSPHSDSPSPGGAAPGGGGPGLGERLELPDVPQAPEVSLPPTLPDAPKVPAAPQVPDISDTPDVQRLPAASQVPDPAVPSPTVPDDVPADPGDVPLFRPSP